MPPLNPSGGWPLDHYAILSRIRIQPGQEGRPECGGSYPQIDDGKNSKITDLMTCMKISESVHR